MYYRWTLLVAYLHLTHIYRLNSLKIINGKTMKKIKIALLLCWLGIHRYKIINKTFGFGSGGAVETIQCKICGINKIRER